MPYELYFDKSSGYLHAVTKGDFEVLEDLFVHLDEVIAEAKGRCQNKVLLDFRELKPKIEDYHATFFTEGLLNRGYPSLGIRFAALVQPEDLEKAKIFETAFCNRAILNKAFTDHDAAVRWLNF